jgi:hypothetical protein
VLASYFEQTNKSFEESVRGEANVLNRIEPVADPRQPVLLEEVIAKHCPK